MLGNVDHGAGWAGAMAGAGAAVEMFRLDVELDSPDFTSPPAGDAAL